MRPTTIEYNRLVVENELLKKALQDIISLPGFRQDECHNVALNAMDALEGIASVYRKDEERRKLDDCEDSEGR